MDYSVVKLPATSTYARLSRDSSRKSALDVDVPTQNDYNGAEREMILIQGQQTFLAGASAAA